MWQRVLAWLKMIFSPRTDTPASVPAPTPEAPSTPVLKGVINGIDIYHGDTVTWSKIDKLATRFVFAKVTEGGGFHDKSFQENRVHAEALGIPFGGYHFFRPQVNTIQQAENFCNAVVKLQKGNLPPVLDWEVGDDVKHEDQIASALSWLEFVEKSLKVTPIIYTGSSFHIELKLPEKFGKYPLWVAHYTTAKEPKWDKRVWQRYTFWQYKDDAKVAGVAGGCDFNVFNGTGEEFQSLLVK